MANCADFIVVKLSTQKTTIKTLGSVTCTNKIILQDKNSKIMIFFKYLQELRIK